MSFYYFLTFSNLSLLFGVQVLSDLFSSHLFNLTFQLDAFTYETSVLASQRCKVPVPLLCLRSHNSLTWKYFLIVHIFQCYVSGKTAHFLLSPQNLLLLKLLIPLWPASPQKASKCPENSWSPPKGLS